MRNDETCIEGNVATVIVRNDHGADPAYNQGQLYLELEMPRLGLEGEAYTGVDANELRDAIDKAVGPRHEADPCEGARPYRPVDRDRLLRHIEDLEATLTRRNERHERDREHIRELEAQLAGCEAALFERKTAREYLDLAWERAVAPEDGMIYKGEEAMVMVHGRGDGPGVVIRGGDTPSRPGGGVEYRLLEPRAEPAKEDLYRKDLESKGLAEWEIELLVGAAA